MIIPGGLEGGAILEGFGYLSTGQQIANVAAAGAVGGGINTGTLRGMLVGAGTSVAFYGVGSIGGSLEASLGAAGANAVRVAGHAAVGCASAAAGGGKCGSGAVSAGFGVVFGMVGSASCTRFVQVAAAGLGGGTGAALTGRRFGDGFAIAAVGQLANELAHNVDRGYEDRFYKDGSACGPSFASWCVDGGGQRRTGASKGPPFRCGAGDSSGSPV